MTEAALSDRTHKCLSDIRDSLHSWCRSIDMASPQDLKHIGQQLRVQNDTPVELKKAMLKEVNEVVIFYLGSKNDSVQLQTTEKPLLDFQFSHSDNAEVFKRQFNEFLLTASNRRLKTSAAELNKTVANQVAALILALKSGTLVHSVSDIEKYFTQHYIINAFMASEDLIVWDGETEEWDYRFDDWKFGWSKRRVWAMKQVFRCRPQHVFVETHQYHEYELMPTIYARINTGNGTRTGWQSTVYAPSGIDETNANASFPSWIANKLYVKADDSETDLEKFLWSSQEFKREEHLQAKNIIYYLVIYNSVYEMLYGSEAPPLQIYIGKAANGVIRRWINDQWAHCRAARDLLNSRKDCRDFPDFVAECKPAKLVDCYLAMAHLRGFQTALFVIQQCDNKVVMEDMEAELILNHDATNMHHGLNCKHERTKTAKVSTKPMAAKVTSATTTMNE